MTPSALKSFLAYWFSKEGKVVHFTSTPELDKKLADNYLSLWQDALAGKYNIYQDTQSMLAKIILFDQIPLNIFRDTAEAFRTANIALKLSTKLIIKKQIDELNNDEKVFSILPFLHSENECDQDIAYYLAKTYKLSETLEIAKTYGKLINRFGRFPHRNALLGRVSSIEELEYLKNKNPKQHA